jgi:ubiquinone/menaquinone biosynthesis C-methylase UbiE
VERSFRGLSRLGSEEEAMTVQTAIHEADFAEVYERILVRGAFDRYARDLVERARPIGPSDRILDLGCGTGIVARVLHERLGAAASVAGVDASPAMLAKARSCAPDVDWVDGDAAALPFADAAFELVLCQHMLQFVPERAAVLREVRRVLSPGGRFLASTWLEGDTLRAELSDAGFTEVRLETATFAELADLPVSGPFATPPFAQVVSARRA